MTNDIKEQLSALLDDELSPEALRLLSQIPDSQELRSTWDSFYLIGDVRRGEGERLSAEGIAGQVRERIAAEPAIISTPRAATPGRGSERWLKPVAGAAIAASVATIAVLAVSEYTDSLRAGDTTVQVAQAPVPISGDTQKGTRWKNLAESKVESKLNRMLVNHSEYAASAGVGMLPYTTFVGYDGNGGRP